MIGPAIIVVYIILFVYSAARWVTNQGKTSLVFVYPDVVVGGLNGTVTAA